MTGARTESSRYEEVRRKLLERGYLEGRIERFVLRGTWSAAGGLLGSGLRAAVIGGPLLGALLAAAAAAANRPLVGASDALLLWCYFSVVCAVVVLVLTLAAALVLATLARNRGARPGDASVAGLLVALPTLGYLGLLWWRRRPEGPLWEDGVFLVAAMLATLLVAWLAGLVSLAGIVGRTGEVPDRRRRAVVGLLLVLFPVAAGWMVARGVAGSGAGSTAAASFELRPRAGRLTLYGIDGLDTEMLRAMAPSGAGESIAAARRRGASYGLGRRPGAEPPEVWTTLLTGMGPERHGIKRAGLRRLPGVATPLDGGTGPVPLDAALRFLLPARTVPTSAASRRVRSLWEIAGLRLPTAAVAWWASWPAVPDPDAARLFLVTDRVLPKLLAGQPGDRDTLPEALFARLAGEFAADRRRLLDDFATAFPAGLTEPVRDWLWEAFLIDAYSLLASERLTADPELRAVFVYLPGLDILRHRLAARDATGLAALVETQRALEGYVRWLDGRVGRVLAPGPGDTAVMVTDPGREGASDGTGLVVVTGSGVASGCDGRVLADVDLVPLVLALLGFPGSAEMGGRLPERCLTVEPHPGRIATYGRRDLGGATEPSEYDSEILERLRSLGYVR